MGTLNAFEVTCKQIKIKRCSDFEQTVSVFYDFGICLSCVVLKLMGFGKLFQVLFALVISSCLYMFIRLCQNSYPVYVCSGRCVVI